MIKDMKNINKTISRVLFGALTLTLTFSSCKKEFLDVKPNNSISNTQAFGNLTTINAAMTGVYDLLSSGSFLYNIILNSDSKGSDAFPNSTGNYNRFINEYRYLETVNDGNLQFHWSHGYRIIANCNQMIENLPGAPISDANKNSFIAQAKAIRAFVHFTLVQEFGAKPFMTDPQALGVPLMLKSAGPDDAPPARAKVIDVYTAILKDLTEAEAAMPSTVTGTYTLTKNAISGILARVHLTKGDWAKASEFAKKAYAGKPLSSSASLLSGFRTPTSEWIWGVVSRDDDNSGYIGVHSFYDPYDDGYSSFRISKEFFNLFSDDDVRKTQFKIPDTRLLSPATGDFYYFGDGYLTSKFIFDGFTNNQVLIRSAEMILTEAEAEARLGAGSNISAAQAALLVVQKRANPNAVISTNTGAALIAEILVERRKELFGEGQRYFDMLRNKEGLNRTASTSHWSKLNLPATDYRFALPLPQAEINVNPNLVQNPLTN
jgi:hypothetical protein